MKFRDSDSFAFFVSQDNKKSALNIIFLSPAQLDYLILYIYYRKTTVETWFREAKEALRQESPDVGYSLKDTSFLDAKALQANVEWARRIYFVKDGFPFEISFGSYGGRNLDRVLESLKSFRIVPSRPKPEGEE